MIGMCCHPNRHVLDVYLTLISQTTHDDGQKDYFENKLNL